MRLAGIVAVIVPVPVDDVVPIVVSVVKSPLALLSSAVKVLPVEKVKPVDVKGIERVQPGMILVCVTAPTFIYWSFSLPKKRFGVEPLGLVKLPFR